MQEREVVLTKREVEARLVPSGTEIMIPSDTFVTITQSLGGTFTVAVNGNLARIEGHNADALGKKPLESSFETPEDGTVNENQVNRNHRLRGDGAVPDLIIRAIYPGDRLRKCIEREAVQNNPGPYETEDPAGGAACKLEYHPPRFRLKDHRIIHISRLYNGKIVCFVVGSRLQLIP